MVTCAWQGLAAYGVHHVKPKFHYALHSAMQWKADGVTQDCFVLERKHQVVKQAHGVRDSGSTSLGASWCKANILEESSMCAVLPNTAQAASPVRNTVRYEESVASRVLLEHLRHLRSTTAERALQGVPVASPLVAAALGRPEAQMANKCRFDGLTLGTGDFVLASGSAGFVRGCVRCGSDFFVLVELVRHVSSGQGHSVWKPRQVVWCGSQNPGGLRENAFMGHGQFLTNKVEEVAAVLLGASEVRLAHCWARGSGGAIRALHSDV